MENEEGRICNVLEEFNEQKPGKRVPFVKNKHGAHIQADRIHIDQALPDR